jgi:hypothetical protein
MSGINSSMQGFTPISYSVASMASAEPTIPIHTVDSEGSHFVENGVAKCVMSNRGSGNVEIMAFDRSRAGGKGAWVADGTASKIGGRWIRDNTQQAQRPALPPVPMVQQEAFAQNRSRSAARALGLDMSQPTSALRDLKKIETNVFEGTKNGRQVIHVDKKYGSKGSGGPRLANSWYIDENKYGYNGALEEARKALASFIDKHGGALNSNTGINWVPILPTGVTRRVQGENLKGTGKGRITYRAKSSDERFIESFGATRNEKLANNVAIAARNSMDRGDYIKKKERPDEIREAGQERLLKYFNDRCTIPDSL